MRKVFITGIGAISAQKTFNSNEFLEEIIDYNDNVIPAHDPVYKDFIPPAAARRMAKGIKMGVVASKLALTEAGLETVDAIITGTGMGCVRDSEKFVSAIIDNNEEFLTPTSFIQSTHNTVAGQIALGLECKGYNFTYVHSSVSFESALLDASLQLQNDEANTILVGGVDELGDHTVKIHRLINHIKSEPVSVNSVLSSNTEGAVFSEGANFFVLSNEVSDQCIAEVLEIETFNTIEKEDLTTVANRFLGDQNLTAEDVDLVIMGNNGDRNFDDYYTILRDGLFAEKPQAYYKHLSGEFNTVSSFGVWMGSKILKHGSIPGIARLNDIDPSKMERILLYNQYRGENHSFILLQKC